MNQEQKAPTAGSVEKPNGEAKANGETKTEEPKVEAQPRPLTVDDIKIPEGFTEVDAPTKEAFIGILNEYKIPPEGLKKLVDLQTGLMKAASEKNSALWQQTQDTWRKEISADAEFGGPRLKENLGLISRLIDEFGSPQLRMKMDLTGSGNDPDHIKFLTKIARAFIAEGGPIMGSPSGSEGRSQAEILFPNQNKG